LGSTRPWASRGRSVTVAGLGEFELIARLAESVERARRGHPDGWGSRVRVGTGDDASVTVPGGATATSVDALVEGVHFRRDTTSAESLGAKALTVALSDLTAMGAEPGEAYVQLGVPDSLDDGYCLALGGGLAAAAAEYRVAVVGGDVTRAPVLLLAMTAVGHRASPDDFVLRSGARPGDVLAVTGELGGAAAGLLILARRELADGLDGEDADRLRGRQTDPAARIGAGLALARSGASAMIDVSDGLGADAAHVAAASGTRLVIELDRLPVQAGVEAVAAAAGIDPAELTTGGGEDYELLAALPEDRLEEAERATADAGTALTRIGWVEEGEDVALRRPDGTELEPRGFDQLRPGRTAR
jgi:thiamine-monophosphate kinase